MWKIKGQLDATDWFLLQNLLSAPHVSGTIMPIIRNSRVIQMVAACGTWRFGLLVVGLVWSCGFMCLGCGMSLNNSSTPDQQPVNQRTMHHKCITLELLMMGMMVPKTCWADNKFCNKNQSVASSWPFIFQVLTTMHGQTHINWTEIRKSRCMFLMGSNITRDANKSSKYKTVFEVSENNNNKHTNTTYKEQGPIPQYCIWITAPTQLNFAPWTQIALY